MRSRFTVPRAPLRRGGSEGFSLRALELAALLHDIGIHEAERKYGSAAGQYQELEGPPIAQKILEQLGAEPELAQRVCYLVGHHHSYTLVDGPDFQALVEADFIVNIGRTAFRRSRPGKSAAAFSKPERARRCLPRCMRCKAPRRAN